MVFINAREHYYIVNEDKNCGKASLREQGIQDFKEQSKYRIFCPAKLCMYWMTVEATSLVACAFNPPAIICKPSWIYWRVWVSFF